jgi:hypothetical protein
MIHRALVVVIRPETQLRVDLDDKQSARRNDGRDV